MRVPITTPTYSSTDVFASCRLHNDSAIFAVGVRSACIEHLLKIIDIPILPPIKIVAIHFIIQRPMQIGNIRNININTPNIRPIIPKEPPLVGLHRRVLIITVKRIRSLIINVAILTIPDIRI